MPNPVANTTDVQGPYSTLSAFTRAVLAAPTGILAVYSVADANRTLTVSFQPVSGMVTYYRVELREAAGKIIASGEATKSPIAIPGAAPAIGTTYTVVVRAEAPGIYGAWSDPVTLTPANLTAPTIASVMNESDTVDVAFQLVTGANSYTAEVVDAQGKSLTPPVVGTGTTSPVSIPAATLAMGQSYQVKVRADIINPPPGS